MVPRYRAWHKELKIMKKVYCMDWAHSGEFMSVYVRAAHWDFEEQPFDTWYARDIELMQWTGLQDKHSKDIFDCDLLKIEGMRGIGRVQYVNGAYKLIFDHADAVFFLGEIIRLRPDVEVVGNRWENAE
ncbi:MAG: YopX family protein [Candidatus Andersenbacteria bacterium]